MLRDLFAPPLQMLTEITLLVLLLGPAPLPIGHCHGDAAVPASDQHLVQHLQLHHGGFANAQNWPDDWHWHWVCPGNGYVGVDGEEVVANTVPILSDPQIPLPEAAYWCRIDTGVLNRASLRPSIPEHRRHSFQFVALMHSRQSLPELLGIIRC